MKKTLYIAYGSNLDTTQMAFRCPGATVVAKSWLHDYRLVFQGMLLNAHANVIPEEGQDVPVVIWEITKQDEDALDLYEGVRGGYYKKEYLRVEVNGRMRKALIYIMTPRNSRNYGIPSDGYLDTIARGYNDFNFDIRILNRAVIHAYGQTGIGSLRKAQ